MPLDGRKVAYSKELKIIDVFERQVKKTPQATAIKGSDFSLTYEELNQKANMLARVIRDSGVESDSIVGIMIPRSAELMIGIIAILKAGGAYMPIDAGYPQRRIDYILENSQCKMVLTISRYNELLQNSNLVLCIDEENAYSDNCDNLERIGSSHDMAYIIYTSGTTGNPKGVMIENHSVINRIEWMQDQYGIRDTDIILQKTPVTFDVSVWELFWWMFVGGSLYLLIPGGEKDPAMIAMTIRKEKISVMHFVPSMLNAFLEYIGEAGGKGLESLSKVFASGEELLPAQVNKFNELLGSHTKLINLYGPTEATVDVTYFPCYEQNHYDKIYIGKPVYNTTMYILDSEDKEVATGEMGELCIAGVQLARGYLHNEDLTREKFFQNPSKEERVYRTGDLARYTENGQIEYIGRIDSQVKIRGFRIEMGEIENALREFEKVKDVAIVANEKENGVKYLSAYIISNHKLGRKEIVEYLDTKIPNYMIPEKFYSVEYFPLSANGKLSRKELSSDNEIIDFVEYIAPESEKERQMVTIWEEVLKVKHIGMEDDFFSLGGNSIAINKIRVKIMESFHKEVKIGDMFTKTKVSSLLKLVEETVSVVEEEIELIHIPLTDRKEISAPQKRIYLACQEDDTGIAYNIPTVIRLKGKLNMEQLNASFQKLVDRHACFRMGFHVIDNQIVQIVEQDIKVSIQEKQVEQKDLEQEVRNCVFAFPLQKAPLIREFVLHINEKEHYLVIDYHHIIADGTSTALIMKELSSLCEEQVEEYTYLDYTEWLKKVNKSMKLGRQQAYWLKELGDVEEYDFRLPYTEINNSHANSNRGSIYFFDIPEKMYEKVQILAKENSCTPYVILYAVYVLWLSKLSNVDKVVSGTVVDNRQLSEMDNVVGMFVNTLLMKFDVPSAIDFRDFLTYCKEKILAGFDNEEYQYDELVKCYRETYSKNLNNYLHTMFVFENTMNETLDLAGIACKEIPFDFKIAKFDLTFIVKEENGLQIGIEYKQCFNETCIRMYADIFRFIMKQVLEQQTILLSKIQIMTDKEEEIITKDFNNTAVLYPFDKRIEELFQDVVKLYPNKIAVSDEKESLTYGELDQLSNAVANSLLEATESNRIGINMKKGTDLVIALIGILKAGKDYVPIDTDAPEARKLAIMNDSNISHIICSQDTMIDKARVQLLLIDHMRNNLDTSLPSCSKNNENAYVMYTSGSTGTPKGVIVTHKNIIRLVKNANYVTLDENTRILQTGSIAFDAITFELWGAMLNGGFVYMATSEIMIDAEKLRSTIRKERINTMWLTAQLFNNIVDQDSDSFSDLKYLLIGGDIISPKHVSKVYENNKSISIINGYGPTENTTFTTCYSIPRDIRFDMVPIGKPISNSTVYILDRDRNIMPVGLVGELYAGGDGVAKGYLDNKEMTEEKFIMHPALNQRLYKTGDLGRWNRYGEIEFFGRKDNQVKIRGFRIELDEIKNALLDIRFIKDAVVVIKKRNENDKFLVAYYVCHKDIACEDKNLFIRSILEKKLPLYMIPNQMTEIDTIPTNMNGKVDYAALPEIAIEVKEEKMACTEVQQSICNFLAKQLRLEQVSMKDNFLLLGGDSLTGTLLKIQIIKRYGIEISLKNILNATDIEMICNEVEKQMGYAQSWEIPTAQQKDKYKASPHQRRLFIEQMKNPESKTYNIQVTLKPAYPLERNKLEDAINQLVAHYEVLRTNFVFVEEEVYQVIRSEVYLSIQDYSNEKENVVFDLGKELLFRVSVQEDAKGINKVLFTIHHIITDGISLGYILKEIEDRYQGRHIGKPAFQYKDYSEWFTGTYEKTVIEKQGAFWKKVFNTPVDLVKLSYDKEEKYEGGLIIGKRVITELENDFYDKMQAYAKEKHITMYSLLMAAFSILLHKVSNGTDITIGTPMSGRVHYQVKEAVGIFVNTVAMRYDINKQKTLCDFVQQVNSFNLEAFENQEYQFDKLTEDKLEERKNSNNNFFNTMLALQNIDLSREAVFGGSTIITYENNENILFDMNVQIYQMKTGMWIDWQYNTSKFYEETIKEYTSYLILILNQIVDNEEQKIVEVTIVEVEQNKNSEDEFEFEF